jgi:hypothetical protein
MPPVKDVGEPCAREAHARFDGRELETGLDHYGYRRWAPVGNCGDERRAYSGPPLPRQFPTLPLAAKIPLSIAIGHRLSV